MGMEDVNTVDTLNLLKQLYLESKYSEAINKLLENKAQFELGQFYYNLGTLQAKSGDMGAARYSFEQSLRAGFDSVMLDNNLSFVKQEVSKKGAIVEYDSISDRSLEFLSSQSLYSFLFVSLAIAIFIQVVFVKLKKPIGLLQLGLLFMAFTPMFIKFYADKHFLQAVVLKNETVWTGPSKVFEKKSDIVSGTKVILSTRNNDWYLIRSPSEMSGWINVENLAFLRNRDE
ncbi:MAG: hypothetical protein Fur0010_00510 [Bdellovibrio sp.]